jgi:uncharacterized protein (TIGR01777 family)
MPGRLVIIAGGTGFIGRALGSRLSRGGDDIAVLTRDRTRAKQIFGDRALVVEWDGRTSAGWRELASRADAVVNLVGENIGAGRWTEERKARLLESRTGAGRAIVEGLRLASPRPKTLIQASAVGFYGPRGDEDLDETASAGKGYLADLVRAWEASTRSAEDLGVRRILIRSGLVLARGGGVLPRFIRQFGLFAGGKLGPGKQWMSWIHRDDEVEAIRYLIKRTDLAGVFNLTAPGPVQMKGFARALGRAMKRPSFFMVPSFLLKWLFGQMAVETILSGQRVLPKALLREDFEFLYPDLDGAFRQIFHKDRNERRVKEQPG